MTREEQYIHQVAKLYGVTVDEIIAATRRITLSPDHLFSFDDFPSLKGKSEKIFDKFAKSLLVIIGTATENEWKKACKDADAVIEKILQTTTISKGRLKGYGQQNLKALSAFQSRKINGMNLSDRVWKNTEQFRQEIELALDMGIGEGLSAAELSRDVRQYLNEPDRLFRRVRDKHGNLVLSKAAKAYNPTKIYGQGIYCSSYKNAMRLTRTETNMAYRTADNMRWQQLDFVVGFEMKLSNNHTINGKPFTDICDELQGRYPKEFKFVGWHPQCRCFSIPINLTPDEFIETNSMTDEERANYKSRNAVNDVPENFKKWVKDNADRIEKANNRGTLPYFLRDNADHAGIAVNPINLCDRAEYINKARAKFDSYDISEWKKKYFDEKTGGFCVYHKDHKFDKTIGVFGIERGDYEVISAKVLTRYGKSVELVSEAARDRKNYDGLLNGNKFDIKAVEGDGKDNLYSDMRNASKKGANTIVLYYHKSNLFDEKKIRESYNRYIGNSQSKRLKNVYYIVDDKLHRMK